MRILLFVLAVLSLLVGVILTGSTNPAHGIEAFISFLIAAVCLSGAGIIEAVNRLRQEVIKGAATGGPPPPAAPPDTSAHRYPTSAHPLNPLSRSGALPPT